MDDDYLERTDCTRPDDDELDELLHTNTCGVDPNLDSMTPHAQWAHEVREYGMYGVKDGTMYSRLCPDCRSWGKGACKPRKLVKRSIIRLKTANVESDCPICYATMKNKKLVQTRCGHLFHSDCLIHWAQKSWPRESCPICREDLENNWAFMDVLKKLKMGVDADEIIESL